MGPLLLCGSSCALWLSVLANVFLLLNYYCVSYLAEYANVDTSVLDPLEGMPADVRLHFERAKQDPRYAALTQTCVMACFGGCTEQQYRDCLDRVGRTLHTTDAAHLHRIKQWAIPARRIVRGMMSKFNTDGSSSSSFGGSPSMTTDLLIYRTMVGIAFVVAFCITWQVISCCTCIDGRPPYESVFKEKPLKDKKKAEEEEQKKERELG